MRPFGGHFCPKYADTGIQSGEDLDKTIQIIEDYEECRERKALERMAKTI